MDGWMDGWMDDSSFVFLIFFILPFFTQTFAAPRLLSLLTLSRSLSDRSSGVGAARAAAASDQRGNLLGWLPGRDARDNSRRPVARLSQAPLTSGAAALQRAGGVEARRGEPRAAPLHLQGRGRADVGGRGLERHRWRNLWQRWRRKQERIVVVQQAEDRHNSAVPAPPQTGSVAGRHSAHEVEARHEARDILQVVLHGGASEQRSLLRERRRRQKEEDDEDHHGDDKSLIRCPKIDEDIGFIKAKILIIMEQLAKK